LLQLGADIVHFEPASERIGDATVGLDSRSVETLKRDYHHLKARYLEVLRDEARLLPVTAWTRLLAMLAGTRPPKHYGCGMGRFYVAVSPQGDLYPCHRFMDQRDYCLGDVRRGLIGGGRERFQALAVTRRSACRACWARYLCGGGCYYEGLVTQGTVERPDPAHCDLTLELITAAIEIASYHSSLPSPQLLKLAADLDQVSGYR